MNVFLVHLLAHMYEKVEAELKAHIPGVCVYGIDTQSEDYGTRDIARISDDRFDLKRLNDELKEHLPGSLVIIQDPANPKIGLFEELVRLYTHHVVYFEPFLRRDSEVTIDTKGMFYFKKNSIRETVEMVEEVPEDWQPSLNIKNHTRGIPEHRYDPDTTVVCFGQYFWSTRTAQSPYGLKYEEYWRELFALNPEVTFLFKNHPAEQYFMFEKSPNVIHIQSNNYHLFSKYKHFVGYFGTTVLEGLSRKKKFMMGGYHFLYGSGLTIDVPPQSNILELFRKHRINETSRRQWLYGIMERYAINLESPDLISRLTATIPKNEVSDEIDV